MRSAHASSISESQYCRVKEFVDNNEIFSSGSTPSRVLIYSWIKEGAVPCKRINGERVIDLTALKACLEVQALQKGFQYEFGKTTLVKLSLFLPCSLLLLSRAAEQSTTWIKRSFYVS